MVDDQELFAQCLYWEAGGEGHCGMVGVGLCIWNRHIRWNQTLQQVILAKNQFTSMANGPKAIPENDSVAIDARSIAGQIMTGKVADITNGACYYANLAIADSPWFTENIVNNPSQHPLKAIIKSHHFFA